MIITVDFLDSQGDVVEGSSTNLSEDEEASGNAVDTSYWPVGSALKHTATLDGVVYTGETAASVTDLFVSGRVYTLRGVATDNGVKMAEIRQTKIAKYKG